jgi:hypothetical protein
MLVMPFAVDHLSIRESLDNEVAFLVVSPVRGFG